MSVRQNRIDEVYAYTVNDDREELVKELLGLLTLPTLFSLLPEERQAEIRRQNQQVDG